MKINKVLIFLIAVGLVATLIIFESDSSSKINSQEKLTGQATHTTYPEFSAPEQAHTLIGDTLTAKDTVIYRTGYYSINGASWQNFTFSGTSRETNWLSGTATTIIPSLGTGENYVVIYSCTQVNKNWDCHGNKWQLLTLNNSCNPNCANKQCGNDGCNGTCGTCTNAHGTTSCTSAGLCQPTCVSGYGNCDNNNINGCETILGTTNNCAYCNNVCVSGTCNNGQCVNVNIDNSPPTIIVETPSDRATINVASQTITASTSDSSKTSTWMDFDGTLIGYWSMDASTSAGIYDNSTYKKFASFNGGLNTNNLVSGVRGKGLAFDGIDDRLDAGTTSLGLSAFTTSAWVRINSNNNGRIISKHGEGSYGWLVARMASSQSVEFKISTTGSNWLGGETSSNSFLTNTWYHIATTYDGNTMRVYINGVEHIGGDFPAAITGNVNNAPASIQIGDDGNSDSNYFNGIIDEVLLFSRALSPGEIKALYDSKANKFSTTINNLASGSHNYKIYAIDELGNTVSTLQRTFTTNIQTTPTCTLGTNTNCAYCGNSCNSGQSCTNNVCTTQYSEPEPSNQIPSGQVYYVSTSGTDSSTRDGSSAYPWRSLSYACSRVTSSGSTIHINAGTYTETRQCILSEGVSIQGEGADSTIIRSTYSGSEQALIKLETPNGWLGKYGNQHIYSLTLDGQMTTAEAIRVNFRSNVKIHDCVVQNFVTNGIIFYGMPEWAWTADNIFETPPSKKMPSYWCTGNEVYNTKIINSASYLDEGNGNLRIGQQDGFKFYNSVITQTSRPAGSNGYGIKFEGEGWNKNTKIYNNKLTMSAACSDNSCSSHRYNFALEMWYELGGNEYYDNTIVGTLDFDVGSKGTSTYSFWIHDNIIGFPNIQNHDEMGINLEASISDAIISNNIIKNVAVGIQVTQIWPIGDHTDYNRDNNIKIHNNVLYNIGITGSAWTFGGVYGIHFADYDSGDSVRDLYIFNNVISASGDFKSNTFDSFGINLPSGASTTNLQIKNNIIKGFNGGYSRNAPISGSGATTNNNLEISYNLFYDNGNNNEVLFTTERHGEGTYIPSSTYINRNNIIDNPLFVSSTDYHLQSGSPAINAGANVGLSSAGPAPDIGAYEYG